MASQQDHVSMALFCDFENVALGVRDAQYDKFDIKRVLERLLLKGSIVVKKAYCDWERYKGFKATMHEANFELIEIPHVRQSGKNSADIRLVVDALDLCYTKSHVNTFVIISGDSDFSPLVSKLRENAKHVIGVGVKQSTSDLLIANCDEFIFYDDLVRESQRQAARRDSRDQPQQRRSPEEEQRRRAEVDARRTKAVEMAAETYEALVTDRDEGGRIWASVLKEALKRRNPGFSEQYYGFRTFGNLLEEAQGRGLLEFGRDEKSGTFVFRGSGVPLARPEPRQEARANPEADDAVVASPAPQEGRDRHEDAPGRSGRSEGRSGGRSGRGRGGRGQDRGNPRGVDLDEPRTEAQQAAARKAYGLDDPNTAAPQASTEASIEAGTSTSTNASTDEATQAAAPTRKAAARKSAPRKAATAKRPAESTEAPAAPAAQPGPADAAPAAKGAAKTARGTGTGGRARRAPAAKKAVPANQG